MADRLVTAAVAVRVVQVAPSRAVEIFVTSIGILLATVDVAVAFDVLLATTTAAVLTIRGATQGALTLRAICVLPEGRPRAEFGVLPVERHPPPPPVAVPLFGVVE